MGQKVNAIGLRLGVNRDWDSKWFAKKGYGALFHKDLMTTEYLTRIYEKEGTFVSKVGIMRTKDFLKVDLYLYLTQNNPKVSGNLTKKTKESAREIIESESLLEQVREALMSMNGIKPKFPGARLKDKLKLSIIFINLDPQSSKHIIKELSMELAAYRSRDFFQDSLQIMYTGLATKSALLLSKYFALQIEKDFRHNQFIDFVKKATPLILKTLPKIKGVRIQFKGRLNGSDRSKTQWFMLGQVPFHTFDRKIEYGFSSAFTPYGVCGIKVWICT